MLVVLAACLVLACGPSGEVPQAAAATPLADTLMSVFAEITRTIGVTGAGCPDEFFQYVHPDEVAKLQQIALRHGYSSLKAYLNNQLRGWPDPDTLILSGVVDNGIYARLALVGNGTTFGHGKHQRRYTFLLFKKCDGGWKLAAMAALEKDAQDIYGNVMTYHETDLPSTLRFPRLL